MDRESYKRGGEILRDIGALELEIQRLTGFIEKLDKNNKDSHLIYDTCLISLLSEEKKKAGKDGSIDDVNEFVISVPKDIIMKMYNELFVRRTEQLLNLEDEFKKL